MVPRPRGCSARAPTCPQQQYQNGESEESHAQFLKALQNAVTTFVNRMKSNHVRGRSITNDSAVLSLFQSINSMHPQLLELLNQLDERRRRCHGARGALSTVSCEHLCWPLAVGTEKGLGGTTPRAAASQESFSGPWATREVVSAMRNVPLSIGPSAPGRIPPPA